MLVALYRLRCCLRRAQMLLLFLGIAYLMAGSILLLQRSSLRVAQQPSPGVNNLLPPPLLSLAAPPTALRMAGLGVGARSRWADTQALSGAGVRAVGPPPHWPRASRSMGVQHLHRRWYHSPVPENPEQRVSLRRSGRHKGTYIGCFLHDANERALGGTVLYDLHKMTSSLCQDTCSESGYRFAGLEYGAECHCGNRISSPRVPEEDCSLACRGERRGSLCGGVGRLSIYKVEEQPPGHRKFRNVHYSGCFRMPKSAVRSFPVYSIQPNLTTQSCIETCTDKELPLAVLMKPHCFCTRTSSLFNPSLQRQEQPCGGSSSTALNHTNTGITALNHTNTGGSTALNHTNTGGSTAMNHTNTGGTTGLNHTNTGGLNHTNTGSLNHTNTSTSTPSTSDEEYQLYEVYHTPMLDSRCKERMFLPQRASSLVALSSFPGAGNTWVRHLIELVTGYYTGSFYFDGTLYNRGFKGEKDYWRSGRSVCVKTHESGQKEIEMFDSAILLIRNPYRSLAAEFNRKCAGHLGHATEAQWKSNDWPEFVDSYAPWWASHALSWLKFGRRLLVVHYEELQRALFPQLRLVTSFLNATLTEDRLLCAQSNQEGHFKRSVAQQPSSFDPFTPSMRRTIDSFIRSVDQALQKRNFSGLPEDYMPR